MTLATQEAIYEEFRTATREHLMKHLKHEGDWKRFNEIKEQADERTTMEHKDWQENYHSRLADARQIILRETHGNVLEEPKPDGIKAIPDRRALDVKADQRIRQDHKRRLSVIKQDELDQYQDLREFLKDRVTVKDRARDDFEQARTRSGPSRS